MKDGNSKNHKFFIKVFGCQYNEWDATKLANHLLGFGFIETTLEEANLVFVLNCSVRKSGVDRALGFARNQSGKKVFVSGCLLEPDRERFGKKKVTFFDISDLSTLSGMISHPTHTNHPNKLTATSKYIPITKGCNNFCSYCVVPYTRGREVSRPINNILSDAKKLIEQKQTEIWLLGQNVNSYEFGFVDLLTELNTLEGDFKIHFTSNHPKDMTDEIIRAIATLPKIAKSVHLPVQSGSDKVLRSMNRPYTKKEYLSIANKIIDSIPNVILSTDAIVGYPTESEADFEETVEMFKKIPFAQVYVNKYSPREGTLAFKLGDPVPWAEKQRRWVILNDLINKKPNLLP